MSQFWISKRSTPPSNRKSKQPCCALPNRRCWLWSPKYEPRIWEQVLALTTPIDGILAREGFRDREPMIKALWSLYYTGFRHAVMHRATGEACLAEIRPALQLILRR